MPLDPQHILCHNNTRVSWLGPLNPMRTGCLWQWHHDRDKRSLPNYNQNGRYLSRHRKRGILGKIKHLAEDQAHPSFPSLGLLLPNTHTHTTHTQLTHLHLLLMVVNLPGNLDVHRTPLARFLEVSKLLQVKPNTLILWHGDAVEFTQRYDMLVLGTAVNLTVHGRQMKSWLTLTAVLKGSDTCVVERRKHEP